MVNIKPKGSKVTYRQQVGCGHCLGCRASEAREWTVRLVHERQMHDYAWMATLTYSEEEIPEYGSLYPADLSSFIKALRREYPPRSISFFGCGEYGEATNRPHYHALLFGPSFLDRRLYRSDSGIDHFRSKRLEFLWPHGLSEFTTVGVGAAAYVASYVTKKIHESDDSKKYDRVDLRTGELVRVHPEFARMSLNPAIGNRWIRRYWRDVYPRDSVVVDGREQRPPRYYDKWMDQEHRDPGIAAYDPDCPCDEHKEVMFNVRCKRDDEFEEFREGRVEAMEAIQRSRLSLFGKRDAI